MTEDFFPAEKPERLGLGALKIYQPPAIFKFTIDPLLLAAFLPIRSHQAVLDLGTGAGVVPLWLTGYRGVRQAVGLELQPQLVTLARRNVALNQLDGRITILEGDLRTPPPELAERAFDWVVSNPPYWSPITHQVPASSLLACAKFELTCTLPEVINAAARHCRDRGRVGLIHLPERLTDLLTFMRAARLEPKRLCLVHPKPGTAPHRVLVEGVKYGRPGLKVGKPFIIHEPDGEFTPEMKAVYQGRGLDAPPVLG